MPVTINSEPKKLRKNSDNDTMQEIPIKRFYLNGNYAGTYLTDREVQCINWLIKGKTAEEIALLLKISKRTAERHIQNTKQKLNCYKQAQLITTMIEQGLIF